MIIWNPWHGCHKVSEGCQHCYMYFLDRMRGIDTSKVSRNANFDMPLKRGRDGRFKVAPGMELLVGLSPHLQRLQQLRSLRKLNPIRPFGVCLNVMSPKVQHFCYTIGMATHEKIYEQAAD